MKKIIPILIIAAGVAGLAIYRSGSFVKEDPTRIHLSGNIELTQVDLSFKAPGRITELPVKEGDRIAAGALVARIDRESPERQKDREQAGLEAAQAAYTQVNTAIDLQRATLEGELALRRAEVQAAEAQLADLQAGSRPQEIESARAQLEDARTWHEQAKRDWDRAQILYKNEDISTQQYDQFRTRFDSTAQTLRQAQQRFDLVKEGPRKQTIEAAKAQLERARAALKLAEASRIELRRREQERAVRQADIQRAKAGIAIVDAQLNDTTIAAPISGVVMVKSAELGEVIAAGATVATLGDLEHPWLRAYISETDLGRVKLGAKVRLTTDSFPGKEYWGTVSYIASEAEFTPKQIQTRDERVKLVYRIKVDVANPNQELKANMPVDAEIVL
ncbi:MAG: HlyD family efflux transporter periplasmic adaptor subunit [Bryobacterales bacterium]|nr:HlyD family efflux transporter periplasmic adaptor subunit [Bryobacterales bacterium]